MKKVLLTATVQSHIGQFHRTLAAMLHDSGYEVHVAARDNLTEKNGLKLDFVDRVYNVDFSRSPLSAGNIRAYRQIRDILAREWYDVVHCNTPMGGVVTRLAAGRARKSGVKIVYTAHGFHFFRGASAFNWLLYYPVERLMARHTDVLITINREDYERARNFPAGKVVYIPGIGMDPEPFRAPFDRADKRRRLGIPQDAFVVLSVGELNGNKNHETVIRAIARLRRDDVYYVVCGNGPLREELSRLGRTLGLGARLMLAGYRRDIPEMMHMADVFVLPSRREGLPVAVMEAITCGLPVVASRIRGAVDLVEDGQGGLLVQDWDADDYARALRRLMDDRSLRERMACHNARCDKPFDADHVGAALRQLYREVCPGG